MGFLKRGRKRTVLVCREGVVLIRFRCLITNLLQLISLRARSCCSPVTGLFIYLFFENLQGIRPALQGIGRRTGVPGASLLVSFAGLFSCLCLAFKSFISLEPCFALKGMLEHGACFYHSLHCLPHWATGTTRFPQHCSCPAIAGPALCSKNEEC